jgi:hypothetical protein
MITAWLFFFALLSEHPLSPPGAQTVLTLLSKIFGSIIAKTLYNVLFHPLRKFPGPLPARASRLYYSYYRSTGQLEIKTKELHEKYGSVVRIAPDEC